MIIRVNSRANIANTEKLLHEIQTAAEPVDLLLPTNVEGDLLGGTVALIQVLATWSARNPEGRLVTYITNQDEADTQLTNLIAHDHGLVAVLGSADVLARDKKSSLRSLALTIAKSRIESMESGLERASHGPKVFLLCADHTSKAFLPCFYFQTDTPDKDVKGIEDFRNLSKQLLNRTAEINTTSERIPFRNVMQIGIILHEIFENTHLWARTDCSGKRIKRSLRGLRFAFHNIPRYGLNKSLGNSPPLSNYFSHSGPEFAPDRQRLVEISVFDSGPGLAQRILQRCLAPSDPLSLEYQAVMKCLRLHSSSSLQTNRGVGLHIVMQLLTELRGFLRVRTGRLNLFRDFVENPYEPSQTDSEPFLLDWQTGTTETSELSRMDGTLFTIFVPISLRCD